MHLATSHPEKVRALIVVDIAPKFYPVHSRKEFEGMNALNLSDYNSRNAIEGALATWVPDPNMLKFLLTNLIREESGEKFRWQMDLPTLSNSLSHFSSNPIGEENHYNGPTLIIYGGKARFVNEEDFELFRKHFPQSEIIKFENSGHNPHVDCRNEFIETVLTFLSPNRK
jgi:esterase